MEVERFFETTEEISVDCAKQVNMRFSAVDLCKFALAYSKHVENGKKLPTMVELYEIANKYTNETCNLNNFFDEDEITIHKMRFVDGYTEAITDLIDENYKPE